MYQQGGRQNLTRDRSGERGGPVIDTTGIDSWREAVYPVVGGAAGAAVGAGVMMAASGAPEDGRTYSEEKLALPMLGGAFAGFQGGKLLAKKHDSKRQRHPR